MKRPSEHTGHAPDAAKNYENVVKKKRIAKG